MLNKERNVFMTKYFFMTSNVVSTGKIKGSAVVLRKLTFYLEEITTASSFAVSASSFVSPPFIFLYCIGLGIHRFIFGLL